MKTLSIPWERAGSLDQALAILAAGGLVAIPTDTVYGLAAGLNQPASIARLYSAKGREREKAIPVLLGSMDAMREVASDLPATAAALAATFWPGPLTLVVPRRLDLPPDLGPEATVGVRMPDHPVALGLLKAAGPLAVTSANRSGGPVCRSAEEVMEALGGRIELILDGGMTPGSQASTVVDCAGDGIRILRQGPVSADAIAAALRSHGALNLSSWGV